MGTSHPTPETDNDVLLNKAPHEFVVPTTFTQALITLPQNALIAFIKLYRAIVSPLYGDVCKYYPTCSAYGLEALTTHGAVRGLSLTVRRILRCHPWATGGLDPVPTGRRTFTPGTEPKIILLNHPHQHTSS
ncbi:membrane protein insertion efficiency factor YidD [Rothia nasimurium]|uniref:membrane protein insertion efficiency factor YidD n=1 Tax=Rothia nasimurium TaxID=85336 RepID=UPI001F492B9F|nr:membrane protein insertion efficiency factor YidD [Rothia nasimurium]